MGSAVILEVFRDPSNSKKYFQLLYHEYGKSQVVTMPPCESGLCELDKFFARAKELTPIDYDAECAATKTEGLYASSDRE
jgi:hypothetical protein